MNKLTFRNSSILDYCLLALGLTALAVAGMLSLSTSSASALVRDCTPNSIIDCGAADVSEFGYKLSINQTGDLPTIYASYGLAPEEYSRFVQTARMGMAYRNGNIVVDGRVVATNTKSIGRQSKSYSHPVNIGGKTYYESATTQVQRSDIPVLVMFNAQGQMEFAVLMACGNPINGTLNNPNYACTRLHVAKDSDTTYRVSSAATAGNGASIAYVIYNFGDGHTETRTNLAENVSHTYAKPGNYQVTSTIYVNIPGNQTIAIAPIGECAQTITVPVPPVYACIVLQAKSLNADKTSFRFTADHSEERATLISGTFVLDNGSAVEVKPDKDGVLSNDYHFTDDKKHTVLVTLKYDVGGTDQTVKCSAFVTPSLAPVCPVPGKENLPPDSPECYTPCATNPNLPIGSPECVATPATSELPSTGPGDVAAMFAVLAAFGAGTHYYLKKRGDRLKGLALATVSGDTSTLDSFIAKNHPNQDEITLAEREVKHFGPEQSSRTSHHRLIQKAAPGTTFKPDKDK